MSISRRQILRAALAAPLVALAPRLTNGRESFDKSVLINTPGQIVPLHEGTDVTSLKLVRSWQGSVCQSRVINRGRQSARIKEVVLFDLKIPLPSETRIYGEGFQMLTQTGGSLGRLADLGNYTDAKH